MANPSVADSPSLADLRREIDRLDESMHGLLMQRGEIIDRLIRVKQSQEAGSAFRPAREAEMMRRLITSGYTDAYDIALWFDGAMALAKASAGGSVMEPASAPHSDR